MIISSSPHQKLAAWLENKENSHKAMMETSSFLETYIEKEKKNRIRTDANDEDDLPSVQESLCSCSESEHTSTSSTHKSYHIMEDDDELYDPITGISDNKEIEDDDESSYNDVSCSFHSDYTPTNDELNDSFSKLKSIANSKHIMFVSNCIRF